MSNAQEAVKTRHKETSLIFPVLALVVLFLWGSSQTLPVVICHQSSCAYWYFK